MKKNFIKDQKLLQYAASAIAFLSVNRADATVIYTDLDPDLVLGGEGAEVNIDINADGTNDFFFNVYSFAGSGTYLGFNFTYTVKVAGASALNGNEFLGTLMTYSGYSAVQVPVLALGEGINGDDNFEGGVATLGGSVQISLSGLPYYGYQFGNWLEADMQYMGFRLNIDTSHYYGWMRLSLNADATLLTIHDYAYQNSANEAIFVGQTATDIENNPLTGTTIFANGNQIHVQLPEDCNVPAVISVYDLAGRKVMVQKAVNGHQVLSAAALPSGNYIVMVGDEALQVKKQVHVQQ